MLAENTMKQRLIKYGKKDGKEFHISKVESGLACGCVCLACGEKLVAKKGKSGKPQDHFAHHNKDNCSYGYETALHYEAKEILEKEKKIFLPYRSKRIQTSDLNGLLYWEFTNYRLGVIKDRVFYLTNITSEKKLHNIIPDIKAQINGREILIEIAVTHKVDEEKRLKLDKIKTPTIEINLSGLKDNFTDTELYLNVIEKTKNKEWIYNKKDENLKSELRNSLNRICKDIQSLKVTKMIKGHKNNPRIFDCDDPLRGRNVSLFNCQKCSFNLATYEYNILCGFTNYKDIVEIIKKHNQNFNNKPTKWP